MKERTCTSSTNNCACSSKKTHVFTHLRQKNLTAGTFTGSKHKEDVTTDEAN